MSVCERDLHGGWVGVCVRERCTLFYLMKFFHTPRSNDNGLFRALKISEFAAVVRIGPDWHGLMHSWTEQKKVGVCVCVCVGVWV